MLCINCSKLAYNLEIKRICIRCLGSINENLSCICENCSKEQNICSVCLKKMFDILKSNINIDCGCGKKK